MTDAYDQAKRRVDRSAALRDYADIILHDWPEEDHLAWVASAPEAEILDWAHQIRVDDEKDGKPPHSVHTPKEKEKT